MKPNFKDLSTELKNRNIRPSHQRIKVLEYLIHNRCHPSVDQIFHELKNEMSTLSKATIYNTLNLFILSGLVRAVTIEDHEIRYDVVTKPHGHFKCISCAQIYDFKINIDDFNTDDLNDFEIINKDVYFKGTCPWCLSNKKKDKEES